jgi:SAM-dependent methyltransferase
MVVLHSVPSPRRRSGHSQIQRPDGTTPLPATHRRPLGAAVTGIDTSRERLEQARRRAAESGVELQLVEADMDEPLPFEDGSFDAATSRLALMASAAPAATLRELRRVVVPDGRIATVIWASLDRNPWFSAPREAIATVLGDERASFAPAFGKLGDPLEAADVHRAAGMRDVEATLLQEYASVTTGKELRALMAQAWKVHRSGPLYFQTVC